MEQILLVLGAGKLEAPILRWAREAGLTTVATDADARVPARRLAHEFHALPPCDVDAHLALARCCVERGEVVGVHAGDARSLRLLARLADALPLPAPSGRALELAADVERARSAWRDAGLPVAGASSTAALEVTGFFRDEVFVRAGIAERRAPRRGATECWILPAEIGAEAGRLVYRTAERAARALGIACGPVHARFARGSTHPELIDLFPGFGVAATLVSTQVFHWSPVQAWLAHLVDAGGPFDEMPLAPRHVGGWIEVRPAPERSSAPRSESGDPWVVVPARGASDSTAILWASRERRDELESTLRAARAILEAEGACTPAA